MIEYPLWTKMTKPQFSSLEGVERCDVGVVGAGLTGITTALLLARAGVKVAVVEADAVGSGTSGRTTAKVTIQHDVRLHGLEERKARGYMAANSTGLGLIEQLIQEYSISCDFAHCPAYVYARTDEEEKEIAREMDIYERIGVSARIMDGAPLPFKVRCALAMDGQASFHPLKYLYALTEILSGMGVPVYERSRVIDLKREDGLVTMRTQQGALHAKAVVLATGYPLIEFPGLFFLRLHQERSYLMALRQKTDTGGMGITAGSPVNSVRTHSMDDDSWLIVGGYGHKTGQEDRKDDTGYVPLEAFLRKFSNSPPEYGWSAQDCATLDSIPYVGGLYKDGPNVYVATGYDKWGMTNSAAASLMLCDLITGSAAIDKETRALFDPMRVAPAASAKGFVVQTADTVRAFTAGRMGIEASDFNDIRPGEGAVRRVDGKARAICKDTNGDIRMFSASCTHLKCPVEYNAAERTFDCQCHGSRFSLTGDVIEGPAKLPLKPAEQE
jgi:glycine/D-amino acid oxidase-like deaminating enzyme/nitrite reductase/ring-hydroxylating ferredoxin subunit